MYCLISIPITSVSDICRFRNAAEFGRDLVSDEDEPDSLGGQIRLHRLPVGVAVVDPERFAQPRLRVYLLALALSFKPRPQRFDLPVRRPISRVVEHLRDHLSARARIGASLHLDERRYALLVKKQMIERPAIRALGAVGDPSLPLDEHPSTPFAAPVLRKDLRMLCDQGLQHVLGLVPLLAHRNEAIAVSQEDRAHALTLVAHRRGRIGGRDRASTVPNRQW
jgi:hypothetical protein